MVSGGLQLSLNSRRPMFTMTWVDLGLGLGLGFGCGLEGDGLGNMRIPTVSRRKK